MSLSLTLICKEVDSALVGDREQKAMEEIAESAPTPAAIDNVKLIKELIRSDEAISTPFPPQKAVEPAVGKRRYFEMVSTERLEYAISDLIERHNGAEAVSSADTAKLLRKWRCNLEALYLGLLDRYQCRESEGAAVVEHNTAPQRLSGCYRIGEQLGRGAFAVVLSAERLSDGRRFAVKMVRKSRLKRWDLRGLRLEIAVLKEVEHENVVRLYDVFESKQRIGIVLERLDGGELLDVVIAKGSFSESEAAQCFAQMLSALQYVHALGIVHRDVKPENLLFGDSVPTDSRWGSLQKDSVKLADFGLAEHCAATSGLREHCGTPIYTAPEVFGGREYGFAVDLWAAGCVLFALLSGTVPFDFGPEHDLKQLGHRVMTQPVEFEDAHWTQISDPAKDLILKLLGTLSLCGRHAQRSLTEMHSERDPSKRMTASDALKHRWMRSASTSLFDERRMNRLRKFSFVRRMQRGVRAMMAVIRLVEIFEAFSARKREEERRERQSLRERQRAVIQQADRLNFVADKLEDRIATLKDRLRRHGLALPAAEREQDGARRIGKAMSMRQRLNDDDDDEMEDEDDRDSESEDMRAHFDRMSSLHQSITAGKIRMRDDDDDSDSE